MEEFTPVTDAEWQQAKAQLPGHVRKGAVLRCTNGECRRFQQRGNWRNGGTLPKPE
jgi:hypothetical protein